MNLGFSLGILKLLNNKHMKTTNETPNGVHVCSPWMTMPIALGIIFVGVRFITNPTVAATDFGIPFSNIHDVAFGRIKGIRDIFSGVALLPLLFLKMRRATAFVFTAAIIIPIADCLIVLVTNGPDIQYMLVHGLTALYMMITSFLLFRVKHNSALQ